MKLPADFYRPLAIGAPEPIRQLPVVPERKPFRRAIAPVLSSGRNTRAALTFGPAMWQCTSTPPGMMMYPRASMTRFG